MIIFDGNKRKYKGNTHIHTIASDGKKTVEELAKIYFKRGYDFIGISDHETFSAAEMEPNEDITVLNGCEITFEVEKHTSYKLPIHISVILESIEIAKKYFDDKVRFTIKTVKEINDILRPLKKENAIITINHPRTSYIDFSDMLLLDNCNSIEIYNHGSEIRANNGFALDHYTYTLANGINVSAIATDDFHMIEHVQSIVPEKDILDRQIGGFIMVEEENKTSKCLIDAIRKGRFYSSTGPRFDDIRYEDGVLNVKFSPANKVKYYANKDMLKIEEGSNITSSYIKKSMIDYFDIRAERDNVVGLTSNYLFIEIEDKDGKKAWTNNLIKYVK